MNNKTHKLSIFTRLYDGTSSDSPFIYTNDLHINSIEDSEILSNLEKTYPLFTQKTKDLTLRNTVLEMLSDKKLIHKTLDHYSISIIDLMKIIYKNYSSLFNPCFIKKLKIIIKRKKYLSHL